MHSFVCDHTNDRWRLLGGVYVGLLCIYRMPGGVTEFATLVSVVVWRQLFESNFLPLWVDSTTDWYGIFYVRPHFGCVLCTRSGVRHKQVCTRVDSEGWGSCFCFVRTLKGSFNYREPLPGLWLKWILNNLSKPRRPSSQSLCSSSWQCHTTSPCIYIL